MVVTRFWDMHSGGISKEKWEMIYIEAPQEEAELIFYNRFKHNPHRVSCMCCGSDYAVDEYSDIRQATAYHRDCDYDTKLKEYVEKPSKHDRGEIKVISLDSYLQDQNVHYIRAEEITESERRGSLPRQGYVWCDESD
jgi:hypothetical protein